jgi:hypothetical protein
MKAIAIQVSSIQELIVKLEEDMQKFYLYRWRNGKQYFFLQVTGE